MKIRSLLLLTAVFLSFSNLTFAKITGESSLKIEDARLKAPKIINDNKNLTVNQEATLEETLKQVDTYMNAARKWEKLKCIPKTSFICTKRECLKRDMITWLILDKGKGTVTRCDGNSKKEQCYTYEASFLQSGVNVNIQGKDPIGSMVKVLGDNRYKEIATIGLDAYIFNGECEIYKE